MADSLVNNNKLSIDISNYGINLHWYNSIDDVNQSEKKTIEFAILPWYNKKMNYDFSVEPTNWYPTSKLSHPCTFDF